jgi:AcrR family transcriptional regulator
MAIIVDKEQKRRDIAFACKDLIFQNGIKNLTVSQVTNQAQIGKGTLYSYFNNKEEIVFKIVDLLMEEYTQKLLKKLSVSSSINEKLKHFTAFFYSSEDIELRELYKEFMSILLMNQRNDISEFKTKCFNNYYGLFKSIIEDAVERKELKEEALLLSHGIFLTSEGMFISTFMRNKTENLKDEIDNYIDNILKLLKTD